MLAPPGIAKANDFNRLALLKDGVAAAISGHIGAVSPKELRRRLRPAGTKEKGKGNGFHHLI